MASLAEKRIVLGITGGIAAYKSAELVRRLIDQGAVVQVVMTEAAKAFIAPLTLQALSGRPVRDSLLDPRLNPVWVILKLHDGQTRSSLHRPALTLSPDSKPAWRQTCSPLSASPRRHPLRWRRP